MHRDENNDRKEKEIERMITDAVQKTLLEDEYMLSHTMAQKFYNKICAILAIVPCMLAKY